MPKKTLKIVILGDSGVGKTSLLNRYAVGKFTGQFKATIGADCVAKEVLVPHPDYTNTTTTGQPPRPLSSSLSSGSSSSYMTPVTLQLWDTAGQERFQSLGVSFYRNSDAAVLVYDVTDPYSLDHLAHWQHEFMLQQPPPPLPSSGFMMGGVGGGGGMNNNNNYNYYNSTIPILVLGNKVDKKDTRAVPMSIAHDWCRRHGIHGEHYFETSAKTATNVDDAFTVLATAALQYHERRQVAYQQQQQQSQLFIPPPAPPSVDLRQHQYHNNNNNNNSNHRNDPCC